MKVQRLVVAALALGVSVAASPVWAGWFGVTVVSQTTGTQLNRICTGQTTASATNVIGCPSTAPSVSTAGDVSVTGNLSANRFIGDGSGLTGIATIPDQIVSGTSSIIVSQSGAISFTTAGSERMVITSAGNVGIGTTSPNAKLEVAGNQYISSNGVLSFNSQAGVDYHLIDLRGPSFGIGVDIEGALTNFVPSGGYNFKWKSNGLTGTTRMFIDTTSGNVGIGTSSPAAKLDVGGSILVQNTGYVGAASGGTASFGTPSNRFYTSDASGFASIYANGSERMRLTAAGNVGIGTTAPARTLDVSGTAQITSSTRVGGTGTPSATLDVSGTVKVAGTGGETCDSQHIGMIRFNPVTGAPQICQP